MDLYGDTRVSRDFTFGSGHLLHLHDDFDAIYQGINCSLLEDLQYAAAIVITDNFDGPTGDGWLRLHRLH